MGGKVWSDAEEKHFWRRAISQSSKRAGIDRANVEKSWEKLATEMQKEMGGQNARRIYSDLGSVEHYFQNIEGERRSPNATLYVQEYLSKLGPGRHIGSGRAPRRTQRTTAESGVSTRKKRTAPKPQRLLAPADPAPRPKTAEEVAADRRREYAQAASESLNWGYQMGKLPMRDQPPQPAPTYPYFLAPHPGLATVGNFSETESLFVGDGEYIDDDVEAMMGEHGADADYQDV
ncbi:hypothetical protein AAE478_004459 [Parahypoxylon ruwenzoriense]